VTVELSVLVPCFNEEGNLPELVERTERVFDRRNIAGEIVLVNDGSRDRTGEQIEALAATRPHVVGVHHPVNRGITEGWRSALARSRGRYVCTIDADLQYQPEAIALLWRETCFSKADLVQGWRSSLERHTYDIRFYMSRGLDHLLKLAFGMHEHDVKSGFIIYKREAFEEILAHAAGYYYFQHLVTVVAKAKGYSIRQVETLFLERRTGKSFISLFPMKMIARSLYDIARAMVEFRFRETKDQSLALALRGRPPTAPSGSAGVSPTTDAAIRAPRFGVSGNPRRYLGELDRTQWLPVEELRQLQLRRLRRLLQHAYEHVGYYREFFQTAGIVPEDVRTLEDLAQLPVLTREAVRDNLYFDLLADTHGGWQTIKLATSGAGGEPIAVFADPFQLHVRWAHAMRGAGWTGYRHPARHACWRRSEPEGRAQTLRQEIEALLLRQRRFSAVGIDHARVQEYVEWIRTTQPALLAGDAEVFNVVASLLASAGRDARGAAAVLTWGQTLTPALRALLERVFGCPVFDEYGTRELGPVAHECDAHRGLHVNVESYIVEVVHEGRPAAEGEVGEVLITDLNSRSVPLIRYQVGDLAVVTARACGCGRGLPLVERFLGRPSAAVVGAHGRYIPAAVFADLFQEQEHAVLRYQVVQDQQDAVTVRIIRKSRFTADTEHAIRAQLARVLGERVTIRLDYVETLPASSGAPEPTCFTRVPVPLLGDEPPAAGDPDRRREVSR
jgi:phenylacetate-CoA ligase